MRKLAILVVPGDKGLFSTPAPPPDERPDAKSVRKVALRGKSEALPRPLPWHRAGAAPDAGQTVTALQTPLRSQDTLTELYRMSARNMYDRCRQATISLICMALAAAPMLPLTTLGDEAQPKSASPPAEPLATDTETASIQVVVGDYITSVQQALHTSITPTITADGNKQFGGQIRLPERGIWVFFDQTGRAYQFRFDAPFGGDIRGAKIGASLEQVNAAMGAPIRDITIPHSLSGKSYLYRVDPARRFAAITTRTREWRRYGY